MAKKRNSGVLGRAISALIIIILLVAIVGAIFEIFVAPAPSKIESRYSDKTSVGVSVTSGQILGVETSVVPAGIELAAYGYSNDSITKNVTAFVVITYTEEKDGNKTTYSAAVIYFASMKDAYTARDGIKDNVKEKGKVTMFRGKSLVIGEKKAVMKYYGVIF